MKPGIEPYVQFYESHMTATANAEPRAFLCHDVVTKKSATYSITLSVL